MHLAAQVPPGSNKSTTPSHVSAREFISCSQVLPDALLQQDGAGNGTIEVLPALKKGTSLHDAHADHVPHTAWATSRSRLGLPKRAVCAFRSWQRYNPTWAHIFVDDIDMRGLLAEHYNTSFMAEFDRLPLGVMKADFFRCGLPKTLESNICSDIVFAVALANGCHQGFHKT